MHLLFLLSYLLLTDFYMCVDVLIVRLPEQHQRDIREAKVRQGSVDAREESRLQSLCAKFIISVESSDFGSHLVYA